jgi:hypothetical protein
MDLRAKLEALGSLLGTAQLENSILILMFTTSCPGLDSRPMPCDECAQIAKGQSLLKSTGSLNGA